MLGLINIPIYDIMHNATTHRAFLDDYWEELEDSLEGTVLYSHMEYITEQLIYKLLYEKSYVQEFKISLESVYENIFDKIEEAKYTLSIEQLDGLLTPGIVILQKFFGRFKVNPWGFYIIKTNKPEIDILFLGDYRILQWSQTDDARLYRERVPRKELLQVHPDPFKPPSK